MADSAQVGTEPIAIVLADDHAMVRTGLRLLLDAVSALEGSSCRESP